MSKDDPSDAPVEKATKADTAESEAPKDSTKSSPDAPQEALISIDAYLKGKGKPERHAAGMLAYTDVRHATMSQWDQIFKSY